MSERLIVTQFVFSAFIFYLEPMQRFENGNIWQDLGAIDGKCIQIWIDIGGGAGMLISHGCSSSETVTPTISFAVALLEQRPLRRYFLLTRWLKMCAFLTEMVSHMTSSWPQICIKSIFDRGSLGELPTLPRPSDRMGRETPLPHLFPSTPLCFDLGACGASLLA